MPLLESADYVFDFGSFDHSERRGRLVHEDELARPVGGAGYCHALPLSTGHLPDQIARPGFGFDLAKEVGRLLNWEWEPIVVPWDEATHPCKIQSPYLLFRRTTA